MKKEPIPFHPLPVILLPVLALLASNIAMVPLTQAGRPILAALLMAGGLWAAFGLGFRNAAKGAMAATGFIIVTFLFGFLLRQFNVSFAGPVWIALWIAAAGGLAVFAGLKLSWTRPLNVLAAMTFGVALIQAGTGYARAASYRPAPAADLEVAKKTVEKRPDIYYIILDGHGSDRSLERVFNLPAPEGLGAGLEKLGFFVADQSRSNYMQTELSLGSSMNMEYLQKLLPDFPPDSDNRSPIKALTNDTKVGRILKAHGYQMIALRMGFFPPVAFTQADFALVEDRGLTFIEGSLLDLTPFGRSETVTGSRYAQHRDETLAAFGNLKRLAGKAAQPRFIVAHVICPHPPFVFGADGSPRRQPGPFGLWDGPDFRHYVGTREDYIAGYREQVQYVNKVALDSVQTILAKDNDALIIVQGDHGSKAGLDEFSADKTDLDEVFSILNAYYVPASVRNRLRPDTSPINSWRIVLSTVFGDDLPELPAESYWSPYPKPMSLVRVTDRLAKSAD